MVILNPTFAFETHEEQELFLKFLCEHDEGYEYEEFVTSTDAHQYWCVKVLNRNIAPYTYEQMYEDFDGYCEKF